MSPARPLKPIPGKTLAKDGSGWSWRHLYGGALCCLAAVALAGCESLPISLPNPLTLVKSGKKKNSWHHVPTSLRSSKLPVLSFQSHEDLSGNLEFFAEPADGDDFGGFRFKPREGHTVTYPRTWRGRIVDLEEIRWPNGESWALFVWDCHDSDWIRIRTISLFDPRVQSLFSCELGFPPDVRAAAATTGLATTSTGDVPIRNYARFDPPMPYWAAASGSLPIRCRFSWSLSLPKNRPYREFLDSIKSGYADLPTWNEPTRGLKKARSQTGASAGFALDRDQPFAERYSAKAEE